MIQACAYVGCRPAHPLHAAQIVLRKGYHLLAAALFVPVFYLDLPMLCVSLAIAFAALVVVEALRCLRAPGLGPVIHHFMQVRRARVEGLAGRGTGINE